MLTSHGEINGASDDGSVQRVTAREVDVVTLDASNFAVASKTADEAHADAKGNEIARAGTKECRTSVRASVAKAPAHGAAAHERASLEWADRNAFCFGEAWN